MPAAVDSPVFITDDGLDATSPTWRQVAAGDAWHAGPFVATGEMVRIAGVEVSVRLAPRHGTRSPTLVIHNRSKCLKKSDLLDKLQWRLTWLDCAHTHLHASYSSFTITLCTQPGLRVA